MARPPAIPEPFVGAGSGGGGGNGGSQPSAQDHLNRDQFGEDAGGEAEGAEAGGEAAAAGGGEEALGLLALA